MLSVLVDVLFKKFDFFLNTPCIPSGVADGGKG
jgi:hypothetical protein